MPPSPVELFSSLPRSYESVAIRFTRRMLVWSLHGIRSGGSGLLGRTASFD